MSITVSLVKKLVEEQFPKWKDLKITPVKNSGHDNRTFHLGKGMTIRLPSHQRYSPQIEKEFKWLPKLKPYISIEISSPLALGVPSKEFPFHWSINKYIEGTSLLETSLEDQRNLAIDLNRFLRELQNTDTTGGPKAGKANFFRGGNLRVYDNETKQALLLLEKTLPVAVLKKVWTTSINSHWNKEPVWIHGDIAPGNLIIKDDKLNAVIDFGILGIGDPACDYAMAWSYFNSSTRKFFLKGLSDETINRARGWALWKSIITYNDNNEHISANAKFTINSILEEI